MRNSLFSLTICNKARRRFLNTAFKVILEILAKVVRYEIIECIQLGNKYINYLIGNKVVYVEKQKKKKKFWN